MRMMRFEFTIAHVPGSKLTHALSRSPSAEPSQAELLLQEEAIVLLLTL